MLCNLGTGLPGEQTYIEDQCGVSDALYCIKPDIVIRKDGARHAIVEAKKPIIMEEMYRELENNDFVDIRCDPDRLNTQSNTQKVFHQVMSRYCFRVIHIQILV